LKRAGVYACSRASVPERVAMWKRHRDAGVVFASSWPDDETPDAIADPAAFWEKAAREIRSAERLVFYVEPDDLPLRGALVEIGMALANNVPVIVVAPNVTLEPATGKPLGNWIKHPFVRFAATLEEAFTLVV
jgi:hypothetical protein